MLFCFWSSILLLGDCWYNAGVVLPFFDVVFRSSFASNHVLHQYLVLSSWGSSSVGSLLWWLLFQGISVLFFHFIFLWFPEAMLPVCYGLLGYSIYPRIVSCWVQLQGSPAWHLHLSVGWAGISDFSGIACSAGILYSCLCTSGSYELWPSLFALHHLWCDLNLSLEFCIFHLVPSLLSCSVVCLQSFHLAYSRQLSTLLTVFPGVFSGVVVLASACWGYFEVFVFPLVPLPVLLLHILGCWFLWCYLCGLISVYNWLPWSFLSILFGCSFSVRVSWFFLTLIASTLLFCQGILYFLFSP